MRDKGANGKGLHAGRAIRGLSSLRLTEALLFWIALLCIVATILPQAPYRPTEGVSPAGRIMMLLSLRDVFHSLWFLVPVALLAVNLLACMRVRMGWRGERRTPAMPAAGHSEIALPPGSDPGQVREGLLRLISSSHAIRSGDEGSPVIHGEKGGLRRFAPLLVHAGILLILLASALAFAGFKGTMEIPEGETRDVVTLYDGTHLHLPFAIRCDRFGIEYYDSGMPREYRSDVSFSANGTTLMQRPVLVNHPVSFRGILFSQSGYDQQYEASLTVKGPSGHQRVSAGQGGEFGLDGSSYRVHVLRVVEDMMRMGPGVQLLVEGQGGQHMLWLFGDIDRISRQYPGITARVPQFNPSLVEPYTFVLDGVIRRSSTILGVNRDPGVPFAAAGALIFTIGVTMIFLMAHERIWAMVEEHPGGITVKLAMRRNGRVAPVDARLCEQVEGLGRGDS